MGEGLTDLWNKRASMKGWRGGDGEALIIWENYVNILWTLPTRRSNIAVYL